jgi:hypothetical protein
VTWPSLSRMPFICDRRSGSCVVGVYVAAAFGIRTGVVGSGVIAYCVCEALTGFLCDVVVNWSS